MLLTELLRRGAKQHFKGLSDHLERCQFTTYGGTLSKQKLPPLYLSFFFIDISEGVFTTKVKDIIKISLIIPSNT